jgi:hypothetical protein
MTYIVTDDEWQLLQNLAATAERLVRGVRAVTSRRGGTEWSALVAAPIDIGHLQIAVGDWKAWRIENPEPNGKAETADLPEMPGTENRE